MENKEQTTKEYKYHVTVMGPDLHLSGFWVNDLKEIKKMQEEWAEHYPKYRKWLEEQKKKREK